MAPGWAQSAKKWWQAFGHMLDGVGKQLERKQNLLSHIDNCKRYGDEWILDVVLDLEEGHTVWPVDVWWMLGTKQWAERTNNQRPGIPTDAWQLTMKGRAAIMERKNALRMGAMRAEERNASDAQLPPIERPDAEWNF